MTYKTQKVTAQLSSAQLSSAQLSSAQRSPCSAKGVVCLENLTIFTTEAPCKTVENVLSGAFSYLVLQPFSCS